MDYWFYCWEARGMIKIKIFLLSLMFLVSCCTFAQEQQIERTVPDLDLVKITNSSWFEFYSDIIPTLSIKGFALDECKTYKFIKGNIFGDFDSNFNKNNSSYLINSEDSIWYIDLDSYKYDLRKSKDGVLYSYGGSIDQEVNLVNRETKDVSRVLFHGFPSQIEDAEWLSPSEVVLYGRFDDSLYLIYLNIEDNVKCYYYFDIDMSRIKSYSLNVRLKEVDFNVGLE